MDKIIKMNPDISVIIPTYNRSESLLKTINSVISGSLPKDRYEIIISDDGSSDETEIIVSQYQAIYSNIVYIKNEHTGSPAKVRNFGIFQARGEIIAFTDDDGIADQYWLEKGIKEFDDLKIAGIEGEVSSDIAVPVKNCYFPVKGRRYSKDIAKGWYGYYLINMFYRKNILEKAGYLDEAFIFGSCEDIDLAWRVLDFGEIKYCPDVLVFHPVKKFYLKTEKIRYCAERNTHQALLCKKHPDAFKIFFKNTLPYNFFHMGYFNYLYGLIKGGLRDKALNGLITVIIPLIIFSISHFIKKLIKFKNRIIRKLCAL